MKDLKVTQFLSIQITEFIYLGVMEVRLSIMHSENQVGINDVEQVSENFKTVVHNLRPSPWQPIPSIDS